MSLSSFRSPCRKIRNTRRPLVEALEPRCMLDAALFRTIDGTDNNLANPEWGSTDEQLLRIAPADYADGIAAPAGEDRPGAREISNALIAHVDEAAKSDRGLSAFIYVWGQFLDHDLGLTDTARPLQPFNIPVPAGDPAFDPTGTGTQEIPLNRSVFDPTTGTDVENPLQQLTRVTTWIDGSMIYGSDEATAASLRTFSGGRLVTSEGDFLPTDESGNFLAGDVRVNENVELTSMHTLFMREHNRIADEIAAADPTLSDEEIYQQARAMVVAEIQAITYNEFLPALLGQDALARYTGYDPGVNPGLANEFSTAGFRLHTTINDDVEFFDGEGRPLSFTYVNAAGETVTVDGEVSLFEAFNNPALFRASGTDGILKYVASTLMEEVDTQVVDSLRDFLFVQVAGGLDLASLNIQRGRDHGLADYNTVREAYGLPRVTSFAEITSDVDLQQRLEAVYGSVDNIDLWVGGLAEDHVPGASVGPLMRAIMVDQFERLRDGDRFWYQNTFGGTQLDRLEQTTLSGVIERNTGIEGLQDNVFFFQAQVQGQVFLDRNADGLPGRRESGLGRVQVELLNDEGEVLATTTTDRAGRYRFDQFAETGDYSIRVTPPPGWTLTTEDTQEVLISAGDVTVRGVNFGVQQVRGDAPPPAPGPGKPDDGNGRPPRRTDRNDAFRPFADLLFSLASADLSGRARRL